MKSSQDSGFKTIRCSVCKKIAVAPYNSPRFKSLYACQNCLYKTQRYLYSLDPSVASYMPFLMVDGFWSTYSKPYPMS